MLWMISNLLKEPRDTQQNLQDRETPRRLRKRETVLVKKSVFEISLDQGRHGGSCIGRVMPSTGVTGYVPIMWQWTG